MMILVVEDEVDIQLLMKKTLQLSGYEVKCAGSGEEGLDIALRQTPDLVIMDLMLPGMDGWEAIGRLRLLGIDAPIIVASAHASSAYEEQASLEGCAAYFPKPFSLSALRARVDELLKPTG